MTNRRYIPETHDPIHRELNQKWRRTDQEIADEMGFVRDTIKSHRLRLGLPLNARPRPVQHATEKGFNPPPEKPNPIKVAEHWLKNRLVTKPSGFWLDGRPASLDTVMKATNEVLKANELLQVGVDRWRV